MCIVNDNGVNKDESKKIALVPNQSIPEADDQTPMCGNSSNTMYHYIYILTVR